MTRSGPQRREAARLLRQRIEIGEHELFLEGLSREQALELLTAVRKAATESGPGSAASVRGAGAVGAGQSAATGAPGSSGPSSGRSARVPSGDAAGKAAASAPSATGALPVLPDSYEELRAEALVCTRCRLAETRTQVVFSDGAVDARLVVVGEAPGANEDATGLPFVGAAGKYLDLLLATVGLSREESAYICNVLKCRPPGNRDPMQDEIEACSPFLEKQLELIRPEALLAVGSFSARLLTGREKSALGKLRGEIHSYEGVPLVCTYHPAALLRNPKWTRAFWEDLQLLRTVLDRA